jgi:hypothetical protein
MADVYIEYLPDTGNSQFDFAARRIVDLLRTYLTSHVGFVDRGDPTAYDFTLASLTTDNTWRDLDLSVIVPSNSKAVALMVEVNDDAVGSYIGFRKNGNTSSYNSVYTYTQVSGVLDSNVVIVFCDSNRIIEYIASNTTFTAINISVIGWFI